MSKYVPPKRQPPFGAIYTPPDTDPPKEPETMQLPNDAQMLNAMRRIHIEGYCGELQRAGGIFEAPDPMASEIQDQRVERGVSLIDDYSLSVWTGRYVAYFAQTTSGDAHEQAIRAVLRDLHNSDEARQKRGEQPGTPPPPPNFSGPIDVAGDEFVVPV